ncbi:MAG TPA: hypothetical protein VFU72_10600, partial [Nitrolancea sp.]|nr:hypothetical protein [Nitrolancea sp.]
GPPPAQPTAVAAPVIDAAAGETPATIPTPEPTADAQPVVSAPQPTTVPVSPTAPANTPAATEVAAEPSARTPTPASTPTPPTPTPGPTPVTAPTTQTELASEPVDAKQVKVQSDAPAVQPWHQGNGPWKATPAPVQPPQQHAAAGPSKQLADPKAPTPTQPAPQTGHDSPHAAPGWGHGKSKGQK